jgi:hypothetical protein
MYNTQLVIFLRPSIWFSVLVASSLYSKFAYALDTVCFIGTHYLGMKCTFYLNLRHCYIFFKLSVTFVCTV